MNRVIRYLTDTRSELAHVSWPTRAQAVGFTVVVIIVSLAVAAYLGLLDWVFALLVERLVL